IFFPRVHAAEWIPNLEQALERAAAEEKIVMADLFAEWCAACKEFDQITFADSGVRAALDELVVARIDFTSLDEYATAISERYDVPGLPCILFLRPDGSEIPGTRLLGFVGPEAFLEHLKRVADAGV